jgi:hypothetical protein
MIAVSQSTDIRKFPRNIVKGKAQICTLRIGSSVSKSIFPAIGLKLNTNCEAFTLVDISSSKPRRIVTELMNRKSYSLGFDANR